MKSSACQKAPVSLQSYKDICGEMVSYPTAHRVLRSSIWSNGYNPFPGNTTGASCSQLPIKLHTAGA